MPRLAANGIEIDAAVTGPSGGVPLLLISGFGTQRTSWPEELLEGLAARGLCVFSFDNRDVGLSTKFSGTPDLKAATAALREGRRPDVPYLLDDMAADAAALVGALGLGSAHIAGASMGGMIAQLVALNHPERARSLVSIMSTTGDPSLPRSDPAAQAALMTPPPATDRDNVVAHGVKTRRVLTGKAYPADEVWLAARLAAGYERSYFPEGQARQWAAIMTAPPRSERLRGLRVPALALHGGDDVLIRPEAGRHTAAQIPGARYVEVPGWGHDFNPAIAPAIAPLIADFVLAAEGAR